MIRKFLSIQAAAFLCASTLALVLGTSAPANAVPSCPTNNSSITNYSYVLTGQDGAVRTVSDLTGKTNPGDNVKVTFTIVPNCTNVQVSLASYRAPLSTWSEFLAIEQTLFDSATGTFSSGTYSLEIDIPATPGTPSAGCTNTKLGPEDFTGNGANVSGPYNTTCDGTASANGNSEKTNNANQPCAGCVGAADNKNPKGQLPNAKNDGNKGYECDGNKGIAQGNPAHSGCTTNLFYQVDFVRGPVLTTLGPAGTNNFYYQQGNRLIDTDLG